MTDEIRGAAGGWEVPQNPDAEGLKEEFYENYVTFRKSSGRFDVFLDGDENVDVWRIASQHGFAICSVTVIDGPFDVKLRVDGKQMARQTADAKEHNHRLDDEDDQ